MVIRAPGSFRLICRTIGTAISALPMPATIGMTMRGEEEKLKAELMYRNGYSPGTRVTG
jgi:hypothetical protein